MRPDFFYDENGFANIVYENPHNNHIYLRKCLDKFCDTTEAPVKLAQGYDGFYPCIQRSPSDGYAGISFYSAPDLMYVKCNTTACSGANGQEVHIVDSDGDCGLASSQAIDKLGNPLMVYHSTSYNALKMSHCHGTVCSGPSTFYLDTDGTVPGSKIRVRGNKQPTILYTSDSDSNFKLIYCTTELCFSNVLTIQTEVTSGTIIHYDMQLYNDLPVILYVDPNTLEAKIIYCNLVDCTSINPPEISVGIIGTALIERPFSLQVDPLGNPTILYYNDNEKALYFEKIVLFTDSPTWSPSQAPSLPPSLAPSLTPTYTPSLSPSLAPTLTPSFNPSPAPSLIPTKAPSLNPSLAPSLTPSIAPSLTPTNAPSLNPSLAPTQAPSLSPSSTPSLPPTKAPSSYNPTVDDSREQYIKNTTKYIEKEFEKGEKANSMTTTSIAIGIISMVAVIVIMAIIIYYLYAKHRPNKNLNLNDQPKGNNTPPGGQGEKVHDIQPIDMDETPPSTNGMLGTTSKEEIELQKFKKKKDQLAKPVVSTADEPNGKRDIRFQKLASESTRSSGNFSPGASMQAIPQESKKQRHIHKPQQEDALEINSQPHNQDSILPEGTPVPAYAASSNSFYKVTNEVEDHLKEHQFDDQSIQDDDLIDAVNREYKTLGAIEDDDDSLVQQVNQTYITLRMDDQKNSENSFDDLEVRFD